MKKIAIIIVAGGRGKRAAGSGNDKPKQYQQIAGKAVLARTIEQFFNMNNINIILPIIHKDDVDLFSNLSLSNDKLLAPVFGGKTRQLSVLAGLEALEKYNPELVLIHDGARPFISEIVVNGVVEALYMNEAVIPATAVIDSIKRSIDGKTIGGSEEREQLFAAQTPQGFDYQTIFNAHKKALNFSDSFSDDAAIAEWIKIPVALSLGDIDNIKITNPDDFLRAERFLGATNMHNKVSYETRVGAGYDIHQFEKGDFVTLGGVKIPHTAKLKGHSDADAALHVLTDAILGALAEGDIGTHFPPSEENWKGEASTTFLKFAVDRVNKRKGRIVHLDLTIMCEAPKISPHTQKLRQSIASICNIDISRISVKATTSEKMGFVGREEGLATMANASIELVRGE